MNKISPISVLIAANPVTGRVAVPDPEQIVRFARQNSTESNARAESRHARRVSQRILVGCACIVLAVGLVVAMMASPKPTVDVAAAAYAATSPGHGILEAVFESRTRVGTTTKTFRQQEWINTATHQVRELVTSSGEITDRVSSPRLLESWSNTYKPTTIRRERTSYSLSQVAWGFGGLQLMGLGGTTTFRDLYRSGKIEVVGHTTINRQRFWKLQSQDTETAGGPHTQLVVLLDPHTFLPRHQALIDVSTPSHPRVVTSSDLTVYRHLVDSSDTKLFDLAVQHPHTTIVTRPGTFPVFRRWKSK